MFETLHVKLRPTCRLIVAALAGLALGGCSATDVVNGLTPDDGYSLTAAVPYGADPRQRLDIYHPETPLEGAPLVVFFYRGGWESGAREDYRFVGQAFAAQGYTIAIPDYRLYPQVGWRGFMSDAAMAVAELANRFPGVATGEQPLVLAGHSAGAYIAVMLALDPSWLEAKTVDRCVIDSVIGLSGPYDFLPLRDATLRAIFGPDPEGAGTQPIQHVDRGDPPMLLMTGLDDVTVLPRNTRRLAARLSDAAVPVVTRYYDGVNHAGLVGSVAKPLRFLAPVLEDMLAYLKDIPSSSGRPCPH